MFRNPENHSQISIHAPHTRSDPIRVAAGGEDALISIHAPHTRSDTSQSRYTMRQQISIHAPHTRSDRPAPRNLQLRRNFNPRSSYEERPSCHPLNNP